MRAKSNFSSLVVQSVARTSLTIFAGISIFIAGFVTWSASGAVVAIYNLF